MSTTPEKALMTAVRELRRRTGLTQTQLATDIGVQLSSVYRFEHTVPPKKTVLARLAVLSRRLGYHDLEQLFAEAWRDGGQRICPLCGCWILYDGHTSDCPLRPS